MLHGQTSQQVLPPLALLSEFLGSVWRRENSPVLRGGLGMTPVVPGFSWLRLCQVRN